MKSERAVITTREELPGLVAELRREGKTIGTLNGSFDLMHSGHLVIIEEAAAQADVLIVGVNSNQSVRQYKGPDRPIVDEKDRLAMLSALRWIDYLTLFDELDPITLLGIIKPDVHTNGSEYGTECIEAPVVRENGGRIHIVDRRPGLSTTEVITKIKHLK